MVMKRLKSENLNIAVQEQLRLFILESGLQSGDPMPTEKTLEEQLGISRASIREGLRAMEALGIIETRHGVGRFLRGFNYDAILESLSYNVPVNVKNFREIIDIRVALESTFIERVTPLLEAADIEELRRLLDRLELEVEEGKPDEDLIKTHTEFHLKLYERANNQLLLHLIRIFSTIQRTLTLLHRYSTSDTAEFIELHRSIIDALEARDPLLARERLMLHFKDVIDWKDEDE